MSANDVTINFDRDNDILYAIKKTADKKNITNVEARSGFVFRFDATTKEVVGFIIHNVSQKMPWISKLEEEYYLMEEIDNGLQLVNDYRSVESKV